MPKITLGKPPAAFAPVDVTFKLPDGSEGGIRCTFKYRTRSQFIEFLTQSDDEAGKASAELADVTELVRQGLKSKAKQMMEMLTAWDLDEPLNEATCQQLLDELPAAERAILTAYSRAVTEGHLGN